MNKLTNNSLFITLGLGLLLVGIINFLYRLFDILENRTDWEFPYWDYDLQIQLTGLVLGLLGGLMLSLRNNGKSQIELKDLIVFLNCIWLAFFIAGAGVGKIYDEQFNVPEQIKDMTLGEVHPSALTWYYFGLFYEYALWVGVIQFVGSILLLFNRTRLLGAATLMPVMLNIVLTNHYFHINRNAYIAAAFLSTGLLYILLIDYKILLNTFIQSKSTDRLISWKSTIPIIVILLVFTSKHLIQSSENESLLKGVYDVQNLQISDSTHLSFQPDNVPLSKIYFEYYTTSSATLQFGTHRKRAVVRYRLMEETQTLEMDIRGNLMRLKYETIDDQLIQFSGTIQEELVEFDLVKIREATK